MDKFNFNLAELTGVKSTATLIWGLIGAALSMSYMPKMTPTQTVLAIASGLITAVALAPLALHSLGWPDSLERGISFLLGLLAMPVLPVLVERVKGFISSMNIRMPWEK